MHHWTLYYRQPNFDSDDFREQKWVTDSQFRNQEEHAGWYKVDSISKEFSKFKSYAAFKKYIETPVQNMWVLRVVANADYPQMVDRFFRRIPTLPAAIHWRAAWN
jgi:hypothetical protein